MSGDVVVSRRQWYALVDNAMDLLEKAEDLTSTIDNLVDLIEEFKNFSTAFNDAVESFKEVEGKVVALRLVDNSDLWRGENNEN